jgi:uncharacterized protein (TIGR03435 family)
MIGHRLRKLNPFKKLVLFAVVSVAVVVLLAGRHTAAAQSSATSPSANTPTTAPAFDVAAIRQNRSDHTARSHIISSPFDGHFLAINVPLKMLIQFAFGIPESQIVDAPEWIGSTKFDIEAKADSALDEQMRGLNADQGKAQKRLMLQALLADRFRLKVRHETRQLPVYVLTIAKNGPRFLETKANGTTIDGGNGKIRVQGGDNTVELLAEQLATDLGRPVIDQTKILGRYDIDLHWSPDELSPTSDISGPSIFTAIQEQLGLKLESQKGPVQVLVIDHVEMPSDN